MPRLDGRRVALPHAPRSYRPSSTGRRPVHICSGGQFGGPSPTDHLPVPLPLPGPVRVAASARAGLFDSVGLKAAGVTEREVRTAVRSGAWVRLRLGLFVTAAHPRRDRSGRTTSRARCPGGDHGTGQVQRGAQPWDRNLVVGSAGPRRPALGCAADRPAPLAYRAGAACGGRHGRGPAPRPGDAGTAAETLRRLRFAAGIPRAVRAVAAAGS
jgi:hypothetical protein